jgi:hypothetical protein
MTAQRNFNCRGEPSQVPTRFSRPNNIGRLGDIVLCRNCQHDIVGWKDLQRHDASLVSLEGAGSKGVNLVEWQRRHVAISVNDHSISHSLATGKNQNS